MGSFRYPAQENADKRPRQGEFGLLFHDAVYRMHNYIQKRGPALKG